MANRQHPTARGPRRPAPPPADNAVAVARLVAEGVRLLREGATDAALDRLGRAVALAPDAAMPLVQQGMALQRAGAADEARRAWRQAVVLAADCEPALLMLAKTMRQHCDWDGLAAIDLALDRATGAALAAGRCPLEGAFLNLHRRDDPARNRSIATAWARHHATGIAPLPPLQRPSGNSRLRLGYLCGQWYSHPVMQCMSFVMAAHDRGRFEVIGFDCGPPRDDPFRRRALAAVDACFQVDLRQPAAAARSIRGQRIDVLVDLTGHTEDPPLAILAHRPAPVQLSYFGFIGTSGATYVDGLVTDRTLVPPSQADWYTEPLLYLPESFLSMGPAPDADEVPTTRGAQGLPADAFVLAAFNATRKLDPAQFDLWLEILAGCPEAVLWQLAEPAAGVRLRERAAARGVDPARVIAAPKVNYFHHLARIRLADLALDTFPYGGGVTSATLLWAGVPVVTLAGRHAASRMTASILHAAGLDELVADTAAAYRDLVLALAADPGRLARLRERTAEGLAASSLLRPDRFAAQLEPVYRAAAGRA